MLKQRFSCFECGKAAHHAKVHGKALAHRSLTMAGQAAARAAGKTWGGGILGRKTRVTPEKEEQIRRLAGEGMSKAAIARTVSLSRPTVYSVLEEADSL